MAQSAVAQIVNLVFLFTQFAGFGIALAGVAILQNNCNQAIQDFNFSGLFNLGNNEVRNLIAQAANSGTPATGSPGQNKTDFDCGIQYSWYWWVVIFQLACTIAGLLANFTALRESKMAITAFFAISTSQWCVFAYPMLWQVYLYQEWSSEQLKNNKWSQGYICGLAGAIVSLVGNFFFLMVFGHDGYASYFVKEGAHVHVHA